jgi:hypothetical protein
MAGTTNHDRPTCPECGAQIQATVVRTEWFSLVDGLWEHYDYDVKEVRYYCENDHAINTDEVSVPDVADFWKIFSA